MECSRFYTFYPRSKGLGESSKSCHDQGDAYSNQREVVKTITFQPYHEK